MLCPVALNSLMDSVYQLRRLGDPDPEVDVRHGRERLADEVTHFVCQRRRIEAGRGRIDRQLRRLRH
jgi:hypothetical protein